MDGLVGKTIKVVVMEADRETNRLIVSEKAVTEADDADMRKKLWGLVKPGEVYDAEVAGVVPFGLFVKVPQVSEAGEAVWLEGLVHISEVSWEKVEDIKAEFKEGDKIKVKVIGMDESTGRLALTMKQLTDDPWKSMVKKFPVDAQVKGKVMRLAAYGAFVEIGKGLEGLVHISKIPPEMKIDAGDEVTCYIESVDSEHRKISLGLVVTGKQMMYK